jgi:hypothetical protein
VTPFFFAYNQRLPKLYATTPKSKNTVIESFKPKLNITTPNIKSCYKTYFYNQNIWRFRQKPYLCNVFFIVLDLRLTKVGVRRDSFFFAYNQRLPKLYATTPKSKNTVIESFKPKLNITTPNIKSCYKTYFYNQNIWRFRQKPYLCNVFFIVLDLRLTKVGVRRDSFFFAHNQRPPKLNTATKKNQNSFKTSSR